MVDVMVQFAAPVSVLRPYVEGGAGAYGEVVGGGRANTGTGANFGAGVKITLVGPSSLRLDYRAFFLDGHAAHSRPQRVYAGLNVSF